MAGVIKVALLLPVEYSGKQNIFLKRFSIGYRNNNSSTDREKHCNHINAHAVIVVLFILHEHSEGWVRMWREYNGYLILK